MQDGISKTTVRISRCTHRRLKIQHDIDENHRKQMYLSTLHSYKHQEQLFDRKINHLKKHLEQSESHSTADDDDDDDDDVDVDEEPSLLTPNCLARVHNHFRLLNFSSETEKRLLCSTSTSKIAQRRHSNQFIRRSSLSQARPVTTSQSARNPPLSKSDMLEENIFQSQRNQQITDEQQNQMKINKRKKFLLKEFDELKHTIDDPYAALSVLAALSRAFLRYDTGTE